MKKWLIAVAIVVLMGLYAFAGDRYVDDFYSANGAGVKGDITY